ncbi:MAG: hypothetical protein M1834_004577 [Cirrosporium novae-zelandiae]|nr:MAG: hypothetical protein M1834_004577 [Cirrosporium novae-zelandiae]
MSPLSKYLLLLSATILPAAVAVPNVTVVPATGGCSAYPDWDASTQIAGPWILRVSQSDNNTIEGFGDTSQYIRKSGDTGIHMGRMTIVNMNQYAKNAIRCNGATSTLEAYTASGVSGYAWNALSLSPYPYDAELLWGLTGGLTVQAYHHYVAGVLQPGLFIGSGNVTTWGYLYQTSEGSTDGLPYYQMRLLGEGSEVPGENGTALYPGEFRGFLMVDGSS